MTLRHVPKVLLPTSLKLRRTGRMNTLLLLITGASISLMAMEQKQIIPVTNTTNPSNNLEYLPLDVGRTARPLTNETEMFQTLALRNTASIIMHNEGIPSTTTVRVCGIPVWRKVIPELPANDAPTMEQMEQREQTNRTASCQRISKNIACGSVGTVACCVACPLACLAEMCCLKTCDACRVPSSKGLPCPMPPGSLHEDPKDRHPSCPCVVYVWRRWQISMGWGQ